MEITTFPYGVSDGEALGVMIGEKMIPAINIQLENMPGPITHSPDNGDASITHNYPIYFESPLETDEHIVVEYWGEEEMPECCDYCDTITYNVVRVTVYKDAAKKEFDNWYILPFEDWKEFLCWYDYVKTPFFDGDVNNTFGTAVTECRELKCH